jgi:hypothetical protein
MKNIERPNSNEYAAYYENFIQMCGADVSILNQLNTNSKSLVVLLKAATPLQLTTPYAASKWTIKDIVQHLIDVERVMVYRAMCFARGEKLPIPFFDEAAYAQVAQAIKQPITKLIKEYTTTRAATITFFANQTVKTFKKRGFATNALTSVRACCYIIAGHELHHLAIIKEKYNLFVAPA